MTRFPPESYVLPVSTRVGAQLLRQIPKSIVGVGRDIRSRVSDGSQVVVRVVSKERGAGAGISNLLQTIQLVVQIPGGPRERRGMQV